MAIHRPPKILLIRIFVVLVLGFLVLTGCKNAQIRSDEHYISEYRNTGLATLLIHVVDKNDVVPLEFTQQNNRSAMLWGGVSTGTPMKFPVIINGVKAGEISPSEFLEVKLGVGLNTLQIGHRYIAGEVIEVATGHHKVLAEIFVEKLAHKDGRSEMLGFTKVGGSDRNHSKLSRLDKVDGGSARSPLHQGHRILTELNAEKERYSKFMSYVLRQEAHQRKLEREDSERTWNAIGKGLEQAAGTLNNYFASQNNYSGDTNIQYSSEYQNYLSKKGVNGDVIVIQPQSQASRSTTEYGRYNVYCRGNDALDEQVSECMGEARRAYERNKDNNSYPGEAIRHWDEARASCKQICPRSGSSGPASAIRE